MQGTVAWMSMALGMTMLLGGCPPGNRSGGTPPTVPEPEGTTDGFTARWDRATDSFARHEETGWRRDACEATASMFRAAAEAPDVEEHRANALYMMGMSNQRCGARPQAIEAYRAALGENEHHCRARVGLGLAQLADGHRVRAEQSFRRSVRGGAPCAEGWLNLAVLERERGELDRAMGDLRRSLATDSHYVEAFHEMALVHLDMAENDIGHLELAAVVCRQAQLTDRRYAPLYNTWGVVTGWRVFFP